MGSRVHLINPSDLSFGVAVITPRWLYVLAAATGTEWGDPCLVDETLDRIDVSTIASGTSSASASTPATPCVDTKSDGRRGSGGHGWCLVGSTRPSSRTKRTDMAAHTLWSKATGM